jgi:hypothetical protein
VASFAAEGAHSYSDIHQPRVVGDRLPVEVANATAGEDARRAVS